MTKIMVIGSGGFLGKHLLKKLDQQNNISEIYAIDTATQNNEVVYNKVIKSTCDISYMPSVIGLFKQFKPDVIIHTAALSSPNIDENRWTDFSHINICGTHYLAHYCPKGCKFIFLSSIVVYGDTCADGKPALKEEPTSLYGASKLAGEKILNVYAYQKRLININLRFCAMVGTGLTHGVLKDFIIKAQNKNPTFPILGNKPGSIKPYIHVDDVIDNIIYSIEKLNFSTTADIAPKDNISIDKIADIVMEKCDIKKEKLWTGTNFSGDNPNILIKHPYFIPYLNSQQAIEKAIDEILCNNN
jgi:UDP-glucose 4-epimerase